jgi:RNA polymerase sigma factor (sigma-70 family)
MDMAAFGRLVEAHHAAVAAVAFAITRDLALAEDVAQDTFVAAWSSLTSLRHRERIRPWLCGIARNQAKKALRRRRREVDSDREEIDVKPSVLEQAIDREAARELEAALAAIPEDYREPLVLFYWEEQSIEQVASMLDLSAQAAQKRISRARTYLKDQLADRFDETGRVRKRASAAAAAIVLAVLSARPTASAAAPAAKASMLPLKALGLTSAGVAMIASVTFWAGRQSDALPKHDPTRSLVAAPAAPALPPRIGAGSAHLPGIPAPSTFGTPSAYELTVLSPSQVAVELAGGRSQQLPTHDPSVATLTRHVRGHVVDEHGRGIAGAVIVVGDELRVQLGALLGEQGATSGGDGSFDIEAHRDDVEYALALHGRGWSAPIAVPPGRSDVTNVVLSIATPGTLAFHARQDGASRQAELRVTRPGFRCVLSTDDHGDFTLPRVAPGSYHVRAQPLQMFVGGNAVSTEQDVTVKAGATTDVALALPTGTLVAVTANHAKSLAAIEYFLAPGTGPSSLAELKKRARAGAIMATLFGGSDLDEPMQFHDVAPGTYTLCIDQMSSPHEHFPLDCRTVEIRGEQPVVELEITLP